MGMAVAEVVLVLAVLAAGTGRVRVAMIVVVMVVIVIVGMIVVVTHGAIIRPGGGVTQSQGPRPHTPAAPPARLARIGKDDYSPIASNQATLPAIRAVAAGNKRHGGGSVP